jgi:hypothetical protein
MNPYKKIIKAIQSNNPGSLYPITSEEEILSLASQFSNLDHREQFKIEILLIYQVSRDYGTMDDAASAELWNMFNPEQELCEELSAYIQECGDERCIKHPLLYITGYDEVYNGMINHNFERKKSLAEKYLLTKDYRSYVFTHQTYYRPYAFEKIAHELCDEGYWDLLRSIMICSDDSLEGQEIWTKLLSAQRSKKYLLETVRPELQREVRFWHI